MSASAPGALMFTCSPKKLNPQVPDGLCKVLEKMMAKDAVDRYQTPGHLILDLLRVQGK